MPRPKKSPAPGSTRTNPGAPPSRIPAPIPGNAPGGTPRASISTPQVPALPSTPPGSTYGQGAVTSAALAAVPLPTPSTPEARFQAAISAAQSLPGATPGGASRPSERPNEPITAGLPFGPGPDSPPGDIGAALSPNILPSPDGMAGITPPEDPTLDVLRGLYAIMPNNDLRGMIEQMEQGAQ